MIWVYDKQVFNWANLQIPECTCSISHNVPFRTEMYTFLFWMEHCGIWNRCILGFVKYVYRKWSVCSSINWKWQWLNMSFMEMSFLVKHAFLCQQRQWTNKKPFTAMDMDVYWFYPWWINVNAWCILTHYPLAAPYHLFLFGLFHDAEVHLISLCAVCQILIKTRGLSAYKACSRFSSVIILVKIYT